MVHQSAQSGEISTERKHGKVFYVFADMIVLLLVAAATFAFLRLTFIRPENREENNPDNSRNTSFESGLEGEGWLSRAISGWLETLDMKSEVGIEIYDLDKSSKLGGVFTEKEFPNQFETAFEKTFNSSEEQKSYISVDEMIKSVVLAFEHSEMSDEDWNSFKQSLEPVIPEECTDECAETTGLAAGFTSEASRIYNEKYSEVEADVVMSYRDLALVELTTKSDVTRSFGIALIGRKFQSQAELKTLGEILEKVILAHIENE